MAAEFPKKDAKLITIPGVSYIPDKMEVAEQPDLVHKVEAEFVDFLTCVTEVLKLLHLLKTKHLRSMTPVPHEVLREILDGKGPMFKQWDKALGGPVAGISLSADNLFKKGMSMASSIGRFKSAMKKDTGVKKRPLEADLVEIIGKKTKPIWHSVALEKQPDPLYNPNPFSAPVDSYEEEPPYPPMRVLDKKDLPLSRTKSEEIIAAIKYLSTTSVKPSSTVYKRQMDMLAASDAGFSSVEEYKAYLETLRPHWFKDLIKDAINIGIITTLEVIEAFENLGEYYDMDPQTVALAKPKMCYLVMSFPIWDIGRMQMQMAINFILHDILKIPRIQQCLHEWLNYRKIPYVAFAPVRSEDLDMSQPQKPADGAEEKAKEGTAEVMDTASEKNSEKGSTYKGSQR